MKFPSPESINHGSFCSLQAVSCLLHLNKRISDHPRYCISPSTTFLQCGEAPSHQHILICPDHRQSINQTEFFYSHSLPHVDSKQRRFLKNSCLSRSKYKLQKSAHLLLSLPVCGFSFEKIRLASFHLSLINVMLTTIFNRKTLRLKSLITPWTKSWTIFELTWTKTYHAAK